ncbi:MAG: PLP-dependent aminotransferase family protein [Rhodospirillaceae bacterium]|nr:PLP-dependent aminotransferase family protein [Rhodospirillaceae bacterium]MBT6117171.1 PLP-dependent aminotransferase family protein [Rhodospirillaceae bacterium]
MALEPGTGPRHRALYAALRGLILSGRAGAGLRLPASRALAKDLALARNTVLAAYDQLAAEGYIEGRRGAGSFVSVDLPDIAPPKPETSPEISKQAAAKRGAAKPPRLSDRGAALAATIRPRGARHAAFSPGLPDYDAFPFDRWGRILARTWRRPARDLFAQGDPAGFPPLRRAIADHLAALRGVRCDPDQVFVTGGSQQAVALAAQALCDPGDTVLVEEPGYPGSRGALRGAGLAIAPMPVDGEGMTLDQTSSAAKRARMAVIAPSHQYPLGVTMSLARRLALLDWAGAQDAWILEDDYDSEYRYAGRPLAALQGLDTRDRVVYLGSFSKVMFPSLRLAYLVAPPALIDAVRAVRMALDDHPSAIHQPALAAFMEEGHFASHIRKTRRLYAARQQALLAAATRHLDGLLDLNPDEAGMHLVARLAPPLAARMDDREAASRAARANLTAPSLSAFFHGKPTAQGLLLGYAAVAEEAMDGAVGRLAAALAT